MTGIGGQPVFECWCGVIWAPTRCTVFRHQLRTLARRDRFARYDLRPEPCAPCRDDVCPACDYTDNGWCNCVCHGRAA